ncbi:hypothetical protein GOHSU_37_00480 [Gordonia hirsuta DSM 44140 = NBRC 16056]|uniref:DUF3710 domain-containing protein n=1 Tax=Gordonia hirsuta DSM 44140 = NBRC 16056 TaxID=1121927 RepID=L7LE54_9ACTN|nr:DUF3710 domain-containing protein [Gordonia hirsuta]GAC58352.1 hypothetical protein GOHSU_37_00480 [Gordonia hirsuta DSM 44140 = NBRC 16056]
MSEQRIGDGAGPYDIDDLTTEPEELANSHLDLGSVLVPVVEGGQVTVEMSPQHEPEAVYLVTPVGRIGVHAFAAPRTGGLWREVVRELAESLSAEGASIAMEDGHWGREVIAAVPGGQHRFIGVDGPRWMVRCVASGPEEDSGQLAQLARAVLAETVVRRGKAPFPPRDLLPLVLPPVLADQVIAAQHQMAQEMGVDTDGAPLASPLEQAPAERSVENGGAPVIPGGAVAQAAAATVFTDDVEPEPEIESDLSGNRPDEESAPGPSEGSAMQRLRGQKKKRRRR